MDIFATFLYAVVSCTSRDRNVHSEKQTNILLQLVIYTLM